MKNWKIYVLIAVLVLGQQLVRFVPSIVSEIQYREWESSMAQAEQEAEEMPERLKALLETHGDDMEAVAAEIESLWEKTRTKITYDTVKKDFQVTYSPKSDLKPDRMVEKVRVAIRELSKDMPLPFEQLMTVSSTPFFYPPGSCVFRWTVTVEEDVLYQFDLVYSTQWQAHRETGVTKDPFGNETAEEVAENWCLVVLKPA